MCQYPSFKHNPREVEGHDVVVADLFSHGETEKRLGLDVTRWHDGHYLLDGTVECRVPESEPDAAALRATMEESVRRRWPTVEAFLTWAYANGADVNAKDENGDTALIWAARYDKEKVVSALLAAGADVNVKNAYGTTALMLAARNGNEKAVAALLAAGADVNAANASGNTALMWAVRYGKEKVAAVLKKAGAK